MSPLLDGARVVAAAALVIAAALAALAALGDVALLRADDAGWRTVAATALADAALAYFCALAAAPAWSAAVAGLRRLKRGRFSLARAWPLVPALAGAVVSLLLTDAFYRPHPASYVIFAGGFGVALAAVAIAASIERRRLRRGLLLLFGAAALGSDWFVPAAINRELRDLIGLIGLACALSLAEPLWRRWSKSSVAGLLLALATGLAAASLVLHFVDGAAPGWRPRAWQRALWQPRLGRALQALVDFDGDGYSPVAWGGDCDDFDAARNPAGHDHDGVDVNCNGTVKPLHATDAERGLAPPAGNPDAPADAVDTVVLITIDTFRADALNDAVTPRLSQLAQSGLQLTRMYSAASSTLHSLALTLRGSDAAPPFAERLLENGIATRALFAYYDPRLESAFFPGFAESKAPTEKERRWPAKRVIDQAIAELSGAPGPRRQLLWLHFFDAHYPVVPADDIAPVPPPHGRTAEFGPYLTALATIDREIGRFHDWLVSSGRAGRTMILITGDHGESLGEHGIGYHGIGAYEAVVHVPGVLVGPGVTAARFTGVASHRDIPATVLGAFGLVSRTPEIEEFGRSWLRQIAAPSAPLHRFVVVRSDRAGETVSMPMAAVIEDRWKLVVTFAIDLHELYTPLEDPRERDDRYARFPEEGARLAHELALYRDIDGYP
jgi:Sulfatase